MVLTCKSYQDDMDYDNVWCLYVEGIEVTSIMTLYGAFM